MKLTDREVAILRVLSDETDEAARGMYAGRIGHLAGFNPSKRVDAGTTMTLDALDRKELVKFEYESSIMFDSGASIGSMGRRWWITDSGREVLGEWAFGD